MYTKKFLNLINCELIILRHLSHNSKNNKFPIKHPQENYSLTDCQIKLLPNLSVITRKSMNFIYAKRLKKYAFFVLY